ncbi:PVC-type heme-binding CxxCH protein [Aquisphaera insulae]|uniref:PVC-type heme-binding CxxCH protein n=1 Tax=Aquisphaera insulae TaxID=2712864 RepID=UPI00202FDC60|nr:PVC-type heme-binding CxxCH protein [Aquisphaera insulae]
MKINPIRPALVAMIVLLAPAASKAQRAPFAIPDPDPEIERKSFIVADGFEVNLYAADPLISKPIQMNFDPAGRLWIASSEVYPQIQPGQKANDKILVLEDADGDGRAEKTTVFADGLLIPTGVEPGDGGCYVGNSTELLHLKDTNGDGKADQTRVMLSGFGTEDTHHIVHTLRWGMDGMLYFNQSIYIHSHIETPHGVRRLGGGGIWRFRPETMELDVFIRGLVNPWGHHVDRWGQSFATDGAGGEGINYCLPGAYYTTAPDAVRILRGLNPGSPKYCGLEIVGGRHLPDDYQGSLVTNDFRGNRVCRFVVSDAGAGFAAREQSELIKTRHVAFRPIDVKMGPDGAIYIADWYNPIIQHGEVDFRDDRRDHTRGRIWRVTAKGRPLVPRPKLVAAAVAELLDALKAPEGWTRHQARRVLKERGAAMVAPALEAWVKRLDPKAPEFELLRLEALWTYQAIDAIDPDLLRAVIESPDARARAAAVRMLSLRHDRFPDAPDLLARRVEDENPRVRLEAVRALVMLPSRRSAEVALRALDRPTDVFLDYALWLTARQLRGDWLPAVEAGEGTFEGNARRLVFALRAAGSTDVLKPLLRLFREGRVPADQDESVETLIASLGGPPELALVLDLAENQPKLDASRRATLLGALTRATRDRKVVPSGDLGRLGRLIDAPEVPLRVAAVRAAGLWKVKSAVPRLVELARDPSTPAEVRAEAIESLIAIGTSEARTVVDEIASKSADRAGQALALGSLAAHDGAAVSRAAGWLSGLADDQGAVAVSVLDRVLERKDGPDLLAKALAGKALAPDVARLCVRAARATGRPVEDLVAAVAKAGKLEAGTRRIDAPGMAAFLAEVANSGDPARGERIFRSKEMTCLKCHSIAGAGGQVGPGLESIGASAQPDYLVDSILEPGKAVKENFHATVVATDDGRLITGIRVRQTDTELVLRDAEDREVAIPLNQIEEQKPGGSLMPTGLTDSLTRGELADLVRFLSELGKIGPYSVSKDRIFRRWQTPTVGAEAASIVAREGAEALVRKPIQEGWSSLYTTVGGSLPSADVPAVKSAGGTAKLGLVRTQLQVIDPGPVRIAVSGPVSTAWIDDRRVDIRDAAIRADLSAGTHTLWLALSLGDSAAPFRVTLEDQPGSAAKAQVLLGK